MENKQAAQYKGLCRQLKQTYCTETYVLANMSRSNRSFIAQLQTGMLPLNIEVGRFQQQKVEEKICPHCKGDKVEDEVHFIFKCPLYSILRAAFIDFVKQVTDINNKCHAEQLSMFMDSISLANKFGTFIRDCYFKRSNFIFDSK